MVDIVIGSHDAAQPAAFCTDHVGEFLDEPRPVMETGGRDLAGGGHPGERDEATAGLLIHSFINMVHLHLF